LISIEQLKHTLDAVWSFRAVLDTGTLPAHQEALKFGYGDRLNFNPETVDRQPVNASQQASVTPLKSLSSRRIFG
jgi:hypothetical protein